MDEDRILEALATLTSAVRALKPQPAAPRNKRVIRHFKRSFDAHNRWEYSSTVLERMRELIVSYKYAGLGDRCSVYTGQNLFIDDVSIGLFTEASYVRRRDLDVLPPYRYPTSSIGAMFRVDVRASNNSELDEVYGEFEVPEPYVHRPTLMRPQRHVDLLEDFDLDGPDVFPL